MEHPLDTNADEMPRERRVWQGRLVAMLLGLLIVIVPSVWVLNGYYNQPITFTYSFYAQDGWCDEGTEGVGVHCFGDFRFPLLLSQQESVWRNEYTNPHSYTGLGMIPYAIADAALSITGAPRVVLAGWLAVLAACLLVPALWVGARASPGDRNLSSFLLPIALIGVATQPFLMTMDRGNTVGYAVPWLLLFVLFLNRSPMWVAPLAVIGAAAVRPQFALIAIAFLAFAHYRRFMMSVVGVLITNVLAFALWPGGFITNITAWLDNAANYQRDSPVADNFPTNLSVAHAVTIPSRVLERLPGPLAEIGRALTDSIETQPAWPGALLLLVTLTTFVFLRRRLPDMIVIPIALALPALVPAVSYGYYTVFVLVVAALIWGPTKLLEPTGPTTALSTGYRWAVLTATAFTLMPLPFVFAEGEHSAVMQNIGLLWSVVVVLGLVVAVVDRSRTPRLADERAN
jgi:hypothetical protein